MSRPKPVDLKQLFGDLQEEMICSLRISRRNIGHPSAMGDASEATWLDMLNKYLPKRYQAEKAFVVDSDGRISEQMDVVVFDRHFSPFLLNHDGAYYVPAESVYAVFEAKQEIGKGYVEYAGKKAKSVRCLKRTSAPVVHAGGVIDKPKAPPRILAGILTLDSTWKPAFGKSCKTALLAQKGDAQLDLGCVIRHGAFTVKTGDGGKPIVEVRKKETALISFFLELLRLLQQMGSVPAMELDVYASRL